MGVARVGWGPVGVRGGVRRGFDFDEFDRELGEAVQDPFAAAAERALESAGPVSAEQSEPWDLVGESGVRFEVPEGAVWDWAGEQIEAARRREATGYSEPAWYAERDRLRDLIPVMGEMLESFRPVAHQDSDVSVPLSEDWVTLDDFEEVLGEFRENGYTRSALLDIWDEVMASADRWAGAVPWDSPLPQGGEILGAPAQEGVVFVDGEPMTLAEWEDGRVQRQRMEDELQDLVAQEMGHADAADRRRSEYAINRLMEMRRYWESVQAAYEAGHGERPRYTWEEWLSHYPELTGESERRGLSGGDRDLIDGPMAQPPTTGLPPVPPTRGLPPLAGPLPSGGPVQFPVLGGSRPVVLPPMGGYQQLPPSVLGELFMSMASQEPPRLGRAHPEVPDRGGRVKPNEPLSEEQKERNRRGIEEAHKTLQQLGNQRGGLSPAQIALLTAAAGAGMAAMGGGGYLGGMGSGMSLR